MMTGDELQVRYATLKAAIFAFAKFLNLIQDWAPQITAAMDI